MKKAIYICISVLIVAFTQSCDQLPEELFEKKIYLVKNGWLDWELNIPNSGTIEISVPVGVSGTSENDKDITVKLGLDQEALATYNYERYRTDTDLYYAEIPQEALAFPENVVINAKQDIAHAVVKIDVSKLTNRYADYVLPLKIESVSEYETNPDYSTGLYHIVFTNKFSGSYSGNMSVTKVRVNGSNDETDKISIGNKVLYAVSPDECFFYAGKYDRNTRGREKFVVTVKMGEEISGSSAKKVLLDQFNPDLDIKYWYNKFDSISTVENNSVPHPNDNRYEMQTTMFDLSYTFMDLGLETPQRYRLLGKMSRIKQVLITEED